MGTHSGDRAMKALDCIKMKLTSAAHLLSEEGRRHERALGRQGEDTADLDLLAYLGYPMTDYPSAAALVLANFRGNGRLQLGTYSADLQRKEGHGGFFRALQRRDGTVI